MGASALKKVADKYGVTLRSEGLREADDDDPGWETDTVLPKAEEELADIIQFANTDEQGYPSTRYVGGLPEGRDRTPDFDYRARGLRGDPGIYWQTYLADPLVKSSVDAGYEGLVSGQWPVERHPEIPDELQDQADEQAEWIHQELIDRPAHWRDFLKGWVFADRVYGFGLWEVVGRPGGGLKKLGWRRPGTVDKWLFTSDGREWAGTRFHYDSVPNVTIGAEDLLHYSTGVGLDLEGLSDLRPIVRWVEIKQLVTQIEAAAAEAHGVGYKTVKPTRDVQWDQSDIDRIIEVVENMAAKDDPVFAYADATLDWISPGGKLPDFDAIRAYCDEQITHALQSTGSLVGLGETGTYALAGVKDEQENIRRIRFFGDSICDLINEHLIPRLIDSKYEDGPVAGLYPRLRFSLGSEAKDPERWSQIGTLAESGVLTWTRDDENRMREELDLEQLPDDVERPGIRRVDRGQRPMSPVDEEDEDDDDGESGFARTVTPDLLLSEVGRLELASDFDPDAVNKWIDESDNAIGRKLKGIARKMREEWVERTRDLRDEAQLARLARVFRNEYQEAFEGAVKMELNRLAIKGSVSTLRELGILEGSGTPQIPADADQAARKYSLRTLTRQFRRHIELQAERIGVHSYNVTESRLLDQTAREAQGATQQEKPEIPTTSAFASQASRYTARTFQHGRREVAKRLRTEAAARGMADPKIVAEYSAMMDKKTCDICEEADGERHFVGSDAYQHKSPPNICKGGDRCRCIWSYILPGAAGWEEIVRELQEEGESQAEGYDIGEGPADYGFSKGGAFIVDVMRAAA